MDIIKNKHKTFRVINFNEIIQENYHYFATKKFWKSIDFGEVRCSLCGLSIIHATFSIKSIENMSEAIDKIIDALIGELTGKKGKRHRSLHVMFDNYTFYNSDNLPIADLDKLIDEEIIKLKKPSFKTRIKNYITKIEIQVEHEELEKMVALADDLKVEAKAEIEQDIFPISDVNVLNDILNEYRSEDSTFFDEQEVEEIGIPDLLNWELRCENGSHINDGDFAEYEATFVGPNGTTLYFSTEMNLMGNGWDLDEI